MACCMLHNYIQLDTEFEDKDWMENEDIDIEEVPYLEILEIHFPKKKRKLREKYPEKKALKVMISLDYFLWSHVKAHVYTDKPASIDALEDNIEVFIREIPAEMVERMEFCFGTRKEVQAKEFSGGLNDWESESSTKIEAAGGHLRVAGANSGAAGAKFYPEGGKS
ncbi:hypothetical protein ACLKA6_010474 [Drosophila palustris]